MEEYRAGYEVIPDTSLLPVERGATCWVCRSEPAGWIATPTQPSPEVGLNLPRQIVLCDRCGRLATEGAAEALAARHAWPVSGEHDRLAVALSAAGLTQPLAAPVRIPEFIDRDDPRRLELFGGGA